MTLGTLAGFAETGAALQDPGEFTCVVEDTGCYCYSPRGDRCTADACRAGVSPTREADPIGILCQGENLTAIKA